MSDPKDPGERPSNRDIQQQAPLQFAAKAENARFAAYFLSHAQPDVASAAKGSAEYDGDWHLALEEAFQREAALALEWVIKALIAQKIQTNAMPQGADRIRVSHNLELLWKDAGLPKPTVRTIRVLLLATRTLLWDERHAAPTEKRQIRDDETQQRLNTLTRRIILSSGRASSLGTMSWADLETVFKIVSEAFEKSQNNYEL